MPFTAALPAGHIELICGSMYSGKSEELIRRVRRALIAKRRVQAFKSAWDDRYAGTSHICSHAGRTVDAIPVRTAELLLAQVHPDTELVAIDEVQFFDSAIVGVANLLADRGVHVLCAGLDLDFRGEGFPIMGALLLAAERVDKLTAVCMVCGGAATRTQRLVDGAPAPADGPTILIGAAEQYEARCRRCHAVPSTMTAAPAATNAA